MKIRAFRENDIGKIKELVTSTMEHEVGFDQKVFPVDDFEDMLNTYGEEKGVFLVAEEEDEIVGGIGLTRESEEVGLLRRFFVHPGFRRKGFGLMLLERVMELSKEKGYKKLEFRATGRMVPAISLCQKKGFCQKEKLSLAGVEIIRLSKDFIDNKKEEKICQQK